MNGTGQAGSIRSGLSIRIEGIMNRHCTNIGTVLVGGRFIYVVDYMTQPVASELVVTVGLPWLKLDPVIWEHLMSLAVGESLDK